MTDDERVASLTELARRVPQWREYPVRVELWRGFAAAAVVDGGPDDPDTRTLAIVEDVGDIRIALDALESALLVLVGEDRLSDEERSYVENMRGNHDFSLRIDHRPLGAETIGGNVKVTDEFAAKHWEALRKRSVLNVHTTQDLARNALAEALSDVPEPDTHFVPVARWHEAVARIAELEAKLEAVRKWADADDWVCATDEQYATLRRILDGE